MKQDQMRLADIAINKLSELNYNVQISGISIDELIDFIYADKNDLSESEQLKYFKELMELARTINIREVLADGRTARHIRYGLRDRGVWIVAVKDSFQKDFPRWATKDKLPTIQHMIEKLKEKGVSPRRYICGESKNRECVGFLFAGQSLQREAGRWLFNFMTAKTLEGAEWRYNGAKRQAELSKHLADLPQLH
jgi:hypothetical protein